MLIRPHNSLLACAAAALLLAAMVAPLTFEGEGVNEGIGKPVSLGMEERFLEGVDSQSDAYHVRPSLQDTPVSYRVQLFIALFYLNHDMAMDFESKNLSSESISHFCRSVNSQASGKQVSKLAQSIGITVETRVKSNGATDKYECDILQVNRDYDNDGEDLLGQGFFILEVAVEQVVYVVSADTLSNREVTDIVETGFNRRSGGRAKFRSLLHRNSAFSTVLDVEALDGSLSAPISAPSRAPSFRPALIPSVAPSLRPSISSVSTPSLTPTPLARSSNPSAHSSTLPTPSPTIARTFAPTGIAPPDDEKSSSQPVIIGAIVVGVATILASYFFVTCVWYPYCCGCKSDEESSVGPEERAQNGGRPVHAAGTIMIPGMVRFDGHHPIAIGNQTAGGVFRPQAGTRMVVDDGMRMLDSFDDSSLYTTTTSQVQDPKSDPVSVDIETPEEEEVEERAEVDQHSSDSSDSYPFFDVKKTSSTMEDITDEENRSQKEEEPLGDFDSKDGNSLFEAVPTLTASSFSNESTNDENVGSSSGVISVGEIAELNKSTDSSEASASKQLEDDVRPSQNRLQSFDSDGSDEANSSSGQRDVEESDSDGDSEASIVPDEAVYSDDKNYDEAPLLGQKRTDNNILLRAVLEDARLLSESKSPSSKSRVSLKSAPSRLTVRRLQALKHSVMAPLDLLADNQELEESWTSHDSRKGTRSVGAPTRSPARNASSDRIVDRVEGERRKHPQLTYFLDMPSRSTLRHFVRGSGATRQGNSSIETAAKQDLCRAVDGSATQNRAAGTGPGLYGEAAEANLGAQPIQKWMSEAEEKQTETPASSPGVLGISGVENGPAMIDDAPFGSDSASNPWLLNATVLTPDHRAPTAESSSGEPFLSLQTPLSDHFKSAFSRIDNRSSEGSTGRRHENNLDRYLSQSPTSHPSTLDPMINGESNDMRGKAEEITITPRTLEHDLKRLEMELAEVLQPENDQNTASSITVSSAGASRSTRSSRMTAKRSKRKRIVVVVPPGKLGVVLADRHDGKGTVVSEVRQTSSMKGMLSPGDRLVAVDGEDVTNMAVSEITKLMASRSEKERRLTVITLSRQRHRLYESKQEG